MTRNGWKFASLLTVNKVIEASDKQVLAASLGLASVGIKVHVAYRFPGTEAADDQRVTVGVNHVHKVCVRLVQPHVRGVALVIGVNILQQNNK